MAKAYYLQHHGILKQKWGVRRFQNEDGTLTEAGKKRYAKNREKYEKKQIDDERKIVDAQRRSMSDQDLDYWINRVQKEKKLHELMNPGKTFIDQVMTDAGKRVLTTAIAGAALYAGKAFITKQFNINDLGNAVFNGGAKKK